MVLVGTFLAVRSAALGAWGIVSLVHTSNQRKGKG